MTLDPATCERLLAIRRTSEEAGPPARDMRDPMRTALCPAGTACIATEIAVAGA